MQYWLLGCRRLVIETDALYIKGMLNNPGMGPNATINRWIEQILMFQFKLKHVKGATFPPDGLSRRDAQPGDEVWANNEEGLDENPSPDQHPDWDYDCPQPLEFDDFKEEIDERGGYFQSMEGVATSVDEFEYELSQARDQEQVFSAGVKAAYAEENLVMPQYLLDVPEQELLLPKIELRDDPAKREPYDEKHRLASGILQDERLKLVKQWLADPMVRPKDMTNKQFKLFMRYSRKFFLDKNGKLYRRGGESTHKLVVEKEHRMYMMRASHNSLGHRGFFATKSLVELRFWWPEFERDVDWFIKSCPACQLRQRTLLKIPPVATMTPSIFQKIHTDVMIMGTPSNNHKFVVAARDSLSRYLEARPLRAENGETLGKFLLEDIICRWGCPQWIVTDNAPQFIAALKWLNAKYGIIGIKISPYNSQANGPVERGHWDMRQSLYKATGGDPKKWYWFFPQVLWADRITIRRGLGCSPYFAVCGAHPITPLDIEEATWLVEYPGEILSEADLIGLRARALAKHSYHVEEMRERVDEEKRKAVRRYEEIHKHTIKDYDFKPGDLVLIRNTRVEKSLDTKMATRYMGPMVVVRRTKGGSYLVCEMTGAMYHGKVGQFRVVPFEQRTSIDLPDNILELIDLTNEELEEMAEDDSEPDEYLGKDMQFHKIRIRPTVATTGDESDDSDADSYMSEDVEEIDPKDFEPEEEVDTRPRRSKRARKPAS
jgi:Integrase zinc binding domain